MAIDSIDKRLDNLISELKTEELRRDKQRQAIEQNRLIGYGLREHEAIGWLEDEPDFNRRIVTPLRDRREGNSPVSRNTQSLDQRAGMEPLDKTLALDGLTVPVP